MRRLLLFIEMVSVEGRMKIIKNFKNRYLLHSFRVLSAISLFLWTPAIGGSISGESNAESAEIRKADIQSAISYISKYDQDYFPVFATLIRTYKITPPSKDVWPKSTGLISYWGGGIANMLSFANIVMLVYTGDRSFEELSTSSGASSGYIKRFNALFNKEEGSSSSCYFERFIARERWITKGVIIADLTKTRADQHQLLVECAAAGADFINGLPFASNRATISDLPPPRVRAAINDAIYRCSLEGSTNIKDPESSKDGLSERPSKACAVDYLIKFQMKLGN